MHQVCKSNAVYQLAFAFVDASQLNNCAWTHRQLFPQAAKLLEAPDGYLGL